MKRLNREKERKTLKFSKNTEIHQHSPNKLGFKVVNTTDKIFPQ